MRSFIRCIFLTGLAIAGFVSRGAGGEWAQFRGPRSAGVSDEVNLPAEWDAAKNVAWKTKIQGYGWSGPIVSGDKIFVTTAVSDNQKKPSGGFGGGFAGGFGKGPPGKGGFGKGGFGVGQPPNAAA
jgi:outer membrane protein assembly factor BamB